VNAQGKAKLLDFGISISKNTPALTRIGCVIGTPEKMAPEQHLGLRGDARSDVWALGILLYEMVAGVPPFTSSSPAGLREDILAVRYISASERKSGLPKRVRRMIATCLRLKPEERYASSGVMLREVQQVRRRLNNPRWRRDLSIGPAIVAGGLAGLGLLLFAYALNQAPDSKTSGSVGHPASLTTAAVPSPPAEIASSAPRDATPASKVRKTPAPPPLPASVPIMEPPPQPGPGAADQRTIRVATYDGPADVTSQEGRLLGSTPFPVSGPLGSTYELWLRRPGYQPRKIDVQINANKTEYLFGLEKREKE
jgi:serine/threonine-protein kinase